MSSTSLSGGDVDASSLLQRGEYLLELGRHQQALDALRSCLQVDPENSRAYVLMSVTLNAMSHHAAARERAKTAIALAPTDATAHRVLALVLLSLDEKHAALAHAEQSVRFSPSDPISLMILSDCLIATKQRRRAHRVAEEALALAPDDATVFLQLAHTSLRRGRVRAARKWVRRSLEIAPDNATAHNTLGVCSQRLRLHASAARSYAVAIQLDPNEDLFRKNLMNMRWVLLGVPLVLLLLVFPVGLVLLLINSVAVLRVHRALPGHIAALWSPPLALIYSAVGALLGAGFLSGVRATLHSERSGLDHAVTTVISLAMLVPSVAYLVKRATQLLKRN